MLDQIAGRRHGRGETSRYRNNLIAPPDPPVTQLRRCQRHKRQQVGRGPRVHQGTMLNPKKLCEFFLEPFRIAAGGQPEVEGRVNQVDDFLLIENPAGIGYSIARSKGRLLPVLDCIMLCRRNQHPLTQHFSRDASETADILPLLVMPRFPFSSQSDYRPACETASGLFPPVPFVAPHGSDRMFEARLPQNRHTHPC